MLGGMDIGTVQLQGPLADRGAWQATRCSIDKALGVVGTRSALLLMREAYYGTRRFDDFAAGSASPTPSRPRRLKRTRRGGAARAPALPRAGQRTRHEYVLTEMGRDLAPAALALMQWGDRYLTGESGPPLALTHTECGAPVHVEVRCEQGHPVPLGEVAVRPTRTRA